MAEGLGSVGFLSTGHVGIWDLSGGSGDSTGTRKLLWLGSLEGKTRFPT